jgi:hypothetical protein
MARKVAALVLAMAMSLPCTGETSKRLWVLVPTFGVQESDKAPRPSLGSKVSTLMFLQLFTTLRKKPTPNPFNLDFGDAGITWDSEALPPVTFDDAERLAQTEIDEDPIMTFWGDISEYGDELFISPRLSVRTDGWVHSVTANPWLVKIRVGDKIEILAAPLPRTRYEFGAFRINRELLSDLNKPGGLELFDAPRANAKRIGRVGDYFKRVFQKGAFAKVVLPGDTESGWIRTPTLSSKPTEALAFTSGLLRVFRHDWQGAKADFLKVKDVPNSPAAVQLDSDLYLALCSSNLGDSNGAISFAKNASQFDEYSFVAGQYLAMSYLAAVSKLNPKESKPQLGELQRLAFRVLPSRMHTDDQRIWLEELQRLARDLNSKTSVKERSQ